MEPSKMTFSFDIETYFKLTPKQQKEVRAFLSSADQKHADEVEEQGQLKADLR